METQTKVNKYLSGTIDTFSGVVGIKVFVNDKKAKPNDPDFNICIQREYGLKVVGALWKSEAKEKPQIEEVIAGKGSSDYF